MKAQAGLLGMAVGLLLAGCKDKPATSQGEAPAIEQGPPGGDTVAVVNGVPILQTELEASLAYSPQALGAQGQPSDADARARLKEKILQKMIADELLVQHARTLGLSIPEEELARRFEQFKKEGGGEAVFQAFLARVGLDEAQMRRNLQRNLLLERLQERLAAEITVEEGELRATYEADPDAYRVAASIELAHLLFRPEDAGPEPLERARKVRAEILEGLAFEDAVRKFSSDAVTRERGGLLGTFRQGELQPELEQAAFATRPGTISEPIRSPAGVHLLKVIRATQGQAMPFDQARPRIVEKLVAERVRKRIEDLSARLAQEGRVTVRPMSDRPAAAGRK